MEVPGKLPTSPLMVLEPVFVTVEAPITAKDWAVPSIVEADARRTKTNSRANRVTSPELYLTLIGGGMPLELGGGKTLLGCKNSPPNRD